MVFSLYLDLPFIDSYIILGFSHEEILDCSETKNMYGFLASNTGRKVSSCVIFYHYFPAPNESNPYYEYIINC